MNGEYQARTTPIDEDGIRSIEALKKRYSEKAKRAKSLGDSYSAEKNTQKACWLETILASRKKLGRL